MRQLKGSGRLAVIAVGMFVYSALAILVFYPVYIIAEKLRRSGRR